MSKNTDNNLLSNVTQFNHDTPLTTSVTQTSSVVPWLVFLISITAQFICMDRFVGLYDEGVILFGAERVFHGEVPYRDFWTMYGPGSFYLTAFLYSMFGISDLVLRVSVILIKGAITSLSYVIVKRFAPKSIALVAAFVILCVLIHVMCNRVIPVFPALALAITSMIFFDLSLRRGNGYLVISGVCTGLATTFRHDLGAYNAIAIVLVNFFFQYLLDERQRLWSIIKNACVQTGAYTAGIFLVIAPVATLLLYAVPLQDLYENLIQIPAKVYPAVRSLPFPRLQRLIVGGRFHPSVLSDFSVYLPFLSAIWATVVEARYIQQLRNKGISYAQLLTSGSALILLLVVTDLFFILKGIVRVSTIHMVQSLVLSIMLLAIGTTRLDWRSKYERCLFAPWLAVAIILIALPTLFGGDKVINGIRDIASGSDNLISRCKTPILPRLRCVSADKDYLLAARFVKTQSNENDLVYVGTNRHDKIFVNAIAFYFMAERCSITKWHDLHPGIQTALDVQRAIVTEMQAVPVRFLILDSRWDNVEEPNDSRISTGVTILDEYIQTHFEEVQRFGSVHILSPL